MSTSEQALLGLLSICPMSGYDIRQLIPQSIGHFWNESYGQIYPALKRMTAAKLVEKSTERSKGRPDRHVYSLTSRGRDELRDWLKSPVASRTVERSELLLKVFFGGQVAPPVVREHVEARRAEAERELAGYAAMALDLKRAHAKNPQLAYWLMTVNMGRHDASAKIAWCRETLAELDQLEQGGSDGA